MTKVLIITGGSKGIGASTLTRFQQEGWHLVNLSRTPATVAGVINVIVDLNQIDSIANHAQTLTNAVANAETVCIVHNAVFYQPDALPSLSLENLQHTLQVNILAPVILNQILIPVMPIHSSIIYLGSTLSEKAVPGSASYIISKHAIIGLMRATAQDLIEKRIRSVCVCPGLVNTELLFNTIEQKTLDFLLTQKVIGKRLIEPVEIADLIYFCASHPVLNSTVIHANLGQIAD